MNRTIQISNIDQKENTLSSLLQKEFGTIWQWIYYSISSSMLKINEISLSLELLWIVNAHGKNLEALEQRCIQAEIIHREIWYYTLRFWNSFKTNFSFENQQIQASIKKYENLYSEFIQYISQLPESEIITFCPINSQYFGQTSHFIKLGQELLEECLAMQKYLENSKSNYLSNTITSQIFIKNIGNFSQNINEILQRIKRPYLKQIILPQDCLSMFLQNIYNFSESSLNFLSLFSEAKLWNHIANLMKIIQQYYPKLFEGTQNLAQTHPIFYLPIFPQEISSVEQNFTVFQKNEYGFIPIKWDCKPLKWNKTECQAIQSLVNYYMQHPNENIYTQILSKLEKIPDKINSLIQLFIEVNPDKNLVEWIQEWWEKTYQSANISAMTTLVESFNIQIITIQNINDYSKEKDFIREEFFFGDKEKNVVKKIGWSYQDTVLQKAVYIHIVDSNMKIFVTLQKLEDWLLKTTPEFYIHFRKELQPLQSPKFWYRCREYSNFCDEILFPILSDIISAMDDYIYKKENTENVFSYTQSRNIRCEYEVLLNEMKKSLQQDHWNITIVAGEMPTLEEIQSMPSWEKKWFQYVREKSQLLPQNLANQVPILHHYSPTHLQRYIATENCSTEGNMIYVREIVPPILEQMLFWKSEIERMLKQSKYLESDRHLLKEVSEQISFWSQDIQHYWPEHQEKLIRQLEQCIQSLTNYISHEEISKIQNSLLISKGFPILLPKPNIIGEKYPSLSIPKELAKAKVEYYFSEQEYKTIQKIKKYAFNSRDVEIILSNGQPDKALQLSWQWLNAMKIFLEKFPNLLQSINDVENNNSKEKDNNPLLKKTDIPCQFSELEKLWPNMLSSISPMSAKEFYENFISQNNQQEIPKFELLIKIMQFSDTLSMIFYPEASELQKVSTDIAYFLSDRNISIQPIDLKEVPLETKIIFILHPTEEAVAIGKRRILNYSDEAIVLQGICKSDYEEIRWDSKEPLLGELKKLFWEYWGHLQKIGNKITREQTINQWQISYYQIQSKPAFSYIIEFLNLSYEYYERIQSSISKFTWQALISPIKNFLNKNGFEVLELYPQEVYNPKLHSLYYDIEESLLSHSEPIGTILRIKQPAILYPKEKRIWQKGKILIAATK